MPKSRPRPHRAPVAALAAAIALAGTAAAGDELFVPNPSADSVTVYPLTAAGDVAPARTLSGPATGIDGDFGLAVDAEHQELFVANLGLNTVTVYPLGAAGDTAPVRTIAGPATQLAGPVGLFIDPAHDELYVCNFGEQMFLVFARTADGDAPPIRTFSSATIRSNTVDFAVDLVHDELVVANREAVGPPSSILVFARTAEGSVMPLREIAGAATGLGEAYGIVVDTFHDEILIASDASIRVFARTASGDVAPLRAIEGAATLLAPGANGIDLDLGQDEIFVSIQGSNAVRVFSRTADGDVAPLRSISGALTGLDLPSLLSLPGPILFGDGFESGDTSGWTGAVP